MNSPTAAAATPLSDDFAHVPWSRQANIYEVNIRQYTPEGTIKAFSAHLPRLKAMGVDILWLMPIQPIGKIERKGTLGSYYSISDYTAVNPEFGTLDDVRALVAQAHALGLKVILDWVANHTAWDHPWTSAHTDWYKLDAQGNVFPVTFNAGTPQVEYWTDVVALNYDNKALWRAMIDAMRFWVAQVDLDGFRCDVAGLVPTPFWNQARQELDKMKPMFMLAEWAEPDLHEQAFDMTYGWDLSDVLQKVAKGTADASALAAWVAQPPKAFPKSAYRMRFTNNHDINSWHGTDAELYGPAWKAMTVLAFTLPGMPLILGGQESGLNKRLAFFEKDTMDWGSFEHQAFYAELLALKHHNAALANGQYGAPVEVLNTSNAQVFAFRRALAGNSVSVVVNCSGQAQAFLGVAGAAKLDAWQWHITTDTTTVATTA
ncbi:MAG: alpha-amylase [Burkholderiales bacterium PBB6]|nr:MAG: alpha-amylase [Burkholderiales bacterium PBB6]